MWGREGKKKNEALLAKGRTMYKTSTTYHMIIHLYFYGERTTGKQRSFCGCYLDIEQRI